MAGAGYKTFTAGEVLTASDVNTYLMQQSVQNYGGTAARSSAIPTPSTGMVSYIGTTGTATIPQLEVYTGSAWQQPYGISLITKVDFTNASSVSINNVFTSQYTNYLVQINLTAMGGTTGSKSVYLRMRASGADYSTANIVYARYVVNQGSGTGANGASNATAILLGQTNSNSTGFAYQATIFGPQTARNYKQITAHSAGDDSGGGGGIYLDISSHRIPSTTQFDGFTLSTFDGSTTHTGSLLVYGYRNS